MSVYTVPQQTGFTVGFCTFRTSYRVTTQVHVIPFMPVKRVRPSLLLLHGTSVSLWTGQSGDRIPVEARFSAPIQTSPEDHPASNTMGTGSFPGVKRPGRGTDHPPSPSAEIKERVELYYYYSEPSRQGIG